MVELQNKYQMGIRRFGLINWLGAYTLYKKETLRFLNVFGQTIIGPISSSILFLLVISIALGKDRIDVLGVSYIQFLAPGLICMAIMQNAFANTSSSILISKVQGNIVDVLMPPLSEFELSFSYALGGMTRGLMVGISVGITIYLMLPTIEVSNLAYILYFAFSSSLLLSLLGILCGIWSEKFDHMASVTNFVIVPLTFLSGTFYTVDRLPEFWGFVANWNPFFYMIDGFRYGFIGYSDSNILVGMTILFLGNLFFLACTIYVFKKGYGLRN